MPSSVHTSTSTHQSWYTLTLRTQTLAPTDLRAHQPLHLLIPGHTKPSTNQIQHPLTLVHTNPSTHEPQSHGS